MRTNRLLLFVIIGITLFGNNAFSQCYIELENHSGLDISFNQSEYNELACEIIDSLPVEFQNDFKVFSFGNYLENRDEGILETNTSNRLAYIQTLSSYYLAFEIIVSPSEGLENIKIHLKLPSTGVFECLAPEDFEGFEIYLNSICYKYINVPGSASSKLFNSFEEIRDEIISFVVEQKECCIPSLQLTECNHCYSSDELISVLEANGFEFQHVAEFDVHDYSTEPDHESNFHQWADFTVKYSGGRTVDLNMEINSWLETANKYFTPIKADIKFFESEQCYKYQEFISSLESEFFDGFLKVFVVGVTSESGPQFGVKTVKGTPVGTGKNIRVLDFENEDVPGFNIETYCSKLEDYINYCGCVSPVTIERPPEENEAVSFFSIAPNDIFILMGSSRFGIFNFVKEYLCDENIVDGKYCKVKLDWYQQEDHENPEVTDMYIGRTIFVDSKSANEKWKLFLPGSTTEEWCALYSIHGIGHLSHPKTRHDGNALDEFGIFGGFMSPGSGIAALVSGDWFQDKYAIRGDPDCFKVIGKQIPTVDSLVIGRKVRVSKHYPECNIWADSNETMKEEICKFLAK